MANGKDSYDFDLLRAIECAAAFSAACDLGCTVSSAQGAILYDSGRSCAACEVCAAAGLRKESCSRYQAYALSEAERFGGKYIYFCPTGLTCLICPILGQYGTSAKITAGPFLMVERDDFQSTDLEDRLMLDPETVAQVLALTDLLPVLPSARVNALSTLLFNSVGFINNIAAENRMLELQLSGAIQGQITAHIMELKSAQVSPVYPIKTEKALLASIVDSDKPRAQALLNELLGHILFSAGGKLSEIQLRIYELLVVISRAAVDAGASAEEIFSKNHEYYKQAAKADTVEDLCFSLSGLINWYIDSLFTFSSLKNADVINKAVAYMRRHCTDKLTLDSVARVVFLSPTYFSKVFNQETGQSFNEYLNRLRIERAKQLLLQSSLLLVDVASLSGFEDQSYFTKVFKRVTGISPNKYRKSGGRAESVVQG